MELLTVTGDVRKLIEAKTYFPFGVSWVTPTYARFTAGEYWQHVLKPAHYVVSSKGHVNSPQYYAVLLGQWAINNDDFTYMEKVADLINVGDLYRAYIQINQEV